MFKRAPLFFIGMFSLVLAACSATTTTTTASFDFEETGTLTRNTPGLTPGVWYLLYEETGNPALTMRLSFEDAECIVNGVRGACERSVFENGLSVTVRGDRENDGVLVEEMEVE